MDIRKPTSRIFLSPPEQSGNELESIKEVLVDNHLAPGGAKIAQLESQLTLATQSAGVIALQSGTQAVHLSLVMAGVTAGDVVLISSFNYIASALPIVYLGAIPCFLESDADTWNISAHTVTGAIAYYKQLGKTVKALIAVHLFGNPLDMEAINAVCQSEGVVVIEDAAESLGSIAYGKPTGGLSRFGVLSFNGNKMVTGGGGGAITFSQKDDFLKAKKLVSLGRNTSVDWYEFDEIGYSYAMSSVTAAIILAQLPLLSERVDKRRKNHSLYLGYLSSNSQIIFQRENTNCMSNRWLNAIYFDRPDGAVIADNIRNKLKLDNIEVRPLWKPLHLQPAFNQKSFYWGNGFSAHIWQSGLVLPSGSNLQANEIAYICEIINQALK